MSTLIILVVLLLLVVPPAAGLPGVPALLSLGLQLLCGLASLFAPLWRRIWVHDA